MGETLREILSEQQDIEHKISNSNSKFFVNFLDGAG